MNAAQAEPGSIEETGDQVAASATTIWETFLDALPRIGVAALVILGGVLASRLMRSALRRVFLRNQTRSFADVMSKLVGWVMVTIASLLAIAVTFPSVKPVDLLAGLGFFSVAIGFAFQDILENLLSGVLLLFRQPFRSGDQIEVSGQEGTVLGITIRETKIKTFDGQLLIIPNRDVYKSAIRVQTAFEKRRLSFTVGVSYTDDLDEARTVIRRVISGIEGVEPEPEPEALVTELNVSTVDIDVRFWTDPRQWEAMMVMDRCIAAVKNALDDAGIEMPSAIVAIQGTSSLQATLTGGRATASGTVLASGADTAAGASGPGEDAHERAPSGS